MKKYAFAGAGGRATTMFAVPLAKEYGDVAQIVGVFDPNRKRCEALAKRTETEIPLYTDFDTILRIYGTKGDIQGHLDRNQILLSDFNSKKIIDVKYDTVSSLVSGHGGGDARLVEDFIDAVKGDTRSMKTSGRLSLQSHRMAFAAEKSRKTGQRISL